METCRQKRRKMGGRRGGRGGDRQKVTVREGERESERERARERESEREREREVAIYDKHPSCTPQVLMCTVPSRATTCEQCKLIQPLQLLLHQLNLHAGTFMHIYMRSRLYSPPSPLPTSLQHGNFLLFFFFPVRFMQGGAIRLLLFTSEKRGMAFKVLVSCLVCEHIPIRLH